MVKDREDWHRLQLTNLKNVGLTFQDEQGSFFKSILRFEGGEGGKKMLEKWKNCLETRPN